jgi:enterochelin esterase family protein
MEEHIVTDSSGTFSRKVWLLRNPGEEPGRLCIFLDGEYYLKHLDAPAVLLELQASGAVPPLTPVFVSNLDNEARHHDFACNDDYAGYIIDGVIPWICGTAGITDTENMFIGGLSLSGLAAAHIALNHPQFSRVLCQSGSFWWNAEWLTREVEGRATVSGKYWVSVGNRETQFGINHAPSGMFQGVDQKSACERLAETLNVHGAEVRYNLHEGAHETAPWKAELPEALLWLLGEASR